jgi:hypothetical protein
MHHRIGSWKYMPYYKVGQGCVWDLTAAVLIVAGLTWVSIAARASGSLDARAT